MKKEINEKQLHLDFSIPLVTECCIIISEAIKPETSVVSMQAHRQAKEREKHKNRYEAIKALSDHLENY